MPEGKEMLAKLATGDAIELQILILFSGLVGSVVVVFFIGRALFRQKPEERIRVNPKPPKNWKNFCLTKQSVSPRKEE